MPPRRKNKPKSTAENDATMPKYPNKKYSKQQKEAFYTEFHGMKNNVLLFVLPQLVSFLCSSSKT
jgi:hypothetical protein